MSDYNRLISRRKMLAALGMTGAAISLGVSDAWGSGRTITQAVYGDDPLVEASYKDIVSLLIESNIPGNSFVLVDAYATYTKGNGGGLFRYRFDLAKSLHDGGRYISDTVPWDGTKAAHAAFLSGIGEENPGSFGCWERLTEGGLFTPEHFGAVVNDESFGNAYIINHALTNTDLFLCPATVYCVEDTVRTGFRWRQLCGLSSVVRSEKGSVLKWIGMDEPRKAVVLIGPNEVGAEPVNDCSGIVCKKFEIVASGPNGSAGFGIYGTYITNETECDRITADGASQHNMYFARGWYAKLTNLTALNGQGCGISLGMPLRYSDGAVENWTTFAPLELNNVEIRNIRANMNGKSFSDNPGLFDPDDAHKLRWGYGIGAGVGNGFRLDTFLAENSGGANLYCYTMFQPSKSIRNGYLESGCLNSGLDPATQMINILIEHTSGDGGIYQLADLYCNYNSGGVLHVGEKRPIKLVRLHQPRFMKSRAESKASAVREFMLTEDVFYMLSTHNVLFTDPVIASGRVNTKKEWEVSTNIFSPLPGYRFSVWVKGEGQPLAGSLIIEYEDGTIGSLVWPVNVSSWTLVGDGTKSINKIRRGGAAGSIDSFANISILHHARTDR